jgi:hypothetical protein
VRKAIDTVLAKDQLQALQASLNTWGIRAFMGSMFWILVKQQKDIEGTKTRLLPFILNKEQDDLTDKLGKKNLVGKSRQRGFTTYFELARLMLPAITEGGIGSLLISHNGEWAGESFRIARRAYRYIGAVDPYDDTQNSLCASLKANLLHIAYSNRKELVFDYLDSKLRIASAEVEESGQTLTLHHVLADEYARWPRQPEATLANVIGALVPGGTLDKVSTANGMAGPYYMDVMRALNSPQDSDSKLHFYPHYWSDDYQFILTEKQKDEMEKDLTEDELKLIAQMHKELSAVAYAKAA